MSNLKYTNNASESPADDRLAELALDLNGSASRVADPLWRQLNPDLWDRTRNPWAVLQTVTGQKLEAIASSPAFQSAFSDALRTRAAEDAAPRWFHLQYPGSALKCLAYFSMEYMLSEALPIYSGGLGNVAGDQLKAASDLGVPVVGVGLLYAQGYFRQELDRDGAQRALYPFNDPGQLPIRPLRDASGDWLRLSIPFPGGDLWIRGWEVCVGRTRLYLLDTNDPANFPEQRGITSELYGGGPELRLRQEIVLGIGGWRLLRALGIEPEVCHLNEGHAAFAVLERAAAYMDRTGESFETALATTRAGNLFTTHTPVEAGFDRFDGGLMRTYFAGYCADRLRIPFDDLMALGQGVPVLRGDPFNMAYLALRGSGAVNGVSRLHGEVSRGLFSSLFPRWPVDEVPVGHVTNGVHVPTWDSPEAHELWAEVCGKACWHGDLEAMESKIRETPDAPIWRMRQKSRAGLVAYVRCHYARQVAARGGSPNEMEAAAAMFDPDALTLGFARRFATYKRPTLLLRDPERLLRILHGAHGPVQLVLAGKAHPHDGAGQAMIREWAEFIQRNASKASVVFLSDYDMLMAQQLEGGVDLWINTPRRPWEASGTSGMKVLVNGGLNLSELDGWWAEAYAPEVGWALGDGQEHGDDPRWDAVEADALYNILEHEVIPEFFDRDSGGVPVKWIARIRESMARLTPEYSANRTVRQYTGRHYVPAASAFAARTERGLGRELRAWQEDVASKWPGVSFGTLAVITEDGQHRFEAVVHLGALDPGAVRVELFANGIGGGPTFRQAMEHHSNLPGGALLYTAAVNAGRPPSDFTPRVIPFHPDAAVPLEASQIVWQK